ALPLMDARELGGDVTGADDREALDQRPLVGGDASEPAPGGNRVGFGRLGLEAARDATGGQRGVPAAPGGDDDVRRQRGRGPRVDDAQLDRASVDGSEREGPGRGPQ